MSFQIYGTDSQIQTMAYHKVPEEGSWEMGDSQL